MSIAGSILAGMAITTQAVGALGWSCKSVEGSPVDLNARVFETSEDSYQLRVVSVEGGSTDPIIHPLLQLDGVREVSQNESLVYSGGNGNSQAELSIRQIAGEFHLPSSLKL